MPTTNVTVTIPAGQSLSNSAPIAGAINLYLVTPTAWEPASNITFQFSADGANYYDLFSGLIDPAIGAGGEVMFGMKGRLNTINPLDVDVPKGTGASVKLRSGTRDKPVPQDANRVFTLVVVT